MKNLFKILLVVAMLAAYSCTTDTTEDLAVDINRGVGQTTVTLSLEASRTQLGEKADGVYPLYWSEGDAIAINGVASAPLSESASGSVAAVFTFEGELAYPYNIVYPAPAEGATAQTEGCVPVVFAAKQNFVEGTFESGTVPMYGYVKAPAVEGGEATVAEGEDATPAIQLNYLAGVLRFAVKGLSNEVLSSMVITSHDTGIAGTYDLNCANGNLVAVEGATTNQIEVSFGDGLALKADEATPIYVAVPAGEYGAITVNLITTDNKVMVVKFSTYGNKGINAGTVREFGEFVFAENSTEANEEGVFEIHTVADLMRFAKIAPVFAPRTEAKLMANLDLTGVEWTPIEGFVHTLNGNDMSIKGLTAPLFSTCGAKIHNLTLTDVAIESSNDMRIGAFANHIINGALVNCEASGSLIYHEGLATGVSVGGLAGTLSYSDFHDCTNRVNITVIGEMTGDLLNDYILRVGGLTATMENPINKMERCNNYGTIHITNDVDRTSIGGLIGFADAALNLDDCHNYGEMILGANVQGSSFSAFTGLIASIDGSFATKNPTFTVTNCSNRGNITFGAVGGEDVVPTEGRSKYFLHLSGMFGYTRDIEDDYFDVKVENCSNYGNIDVNGAGSTSAIKVGGIFTQMATDALLNNCHNYGKLGYTRSHYDGATGQIWLGGLIAHSVSSIPDNGIATTTYTNCTNEGELYVKQHIHNTGIPYIGGITGYVSGYSAIVFDNVQNKAPLNIDGTVTDQNIYVGSFCGYLAGKDLSIINCVNEGHITVNMSLSAMENNIYVGGIFGHNGSAVNTQIKKVENKGNVTLTGASGRVMLTGFISSTSNDMTLEECSNSGNIKLENKQAHNIKFLWFGGLVGAILNTEDNKTITLNNCINSGDLTMKNTTVEAVTGVGGIAGQMIYASNNKYYGTIIATDCTNEGDIIIDNSIGMGTDFSIGGFVGATTIGLAKDGQTLLYNPTQKGNILINHTGEDVSVHLNVGGLVGVFVAGEVTKNAAGKRGTVSGKIEINSKSAVGAQWRSIGGITGEARGAIKASHIDIVAKEGDSYSVNLRSMKAGIYTGGLIGYCNGAVELSNITTNMPVNSKTPICTSGSIITGGIAGYIPESKAASFNNITNSGAITADGGDCATAMYVSGAFGYVLSAITASDITNNGAITATASTKAAGVLNVGGILGINGKAHGSYTNLTNNGAITVKKGGGSYAGIYLGGITGGENTPETATNHYFNCLNSGDITLEEGIVSTGNIRMGGCFSWIKGCYSDKIKNTGDIYVHAQTSGTGRQILFGGVYGYNANVTPDMAGENGYINTGDITITGGTPGSTNAFATTIGGVVGCYYGNLKNGINTGNITFTGDYGHTNSAIGGILAHSTSAGTISDCKQYGDILVYPSTNPADTKYKDVTGVITGSARVEQNGKTARTAVVRNCYLGGRIAFSATNGVDANGDNELKPAWENITEANYFDYIYRGLQNQWAAGSDYDGCLPLTAAPTLPW